LHIHDELKALVAKWRPNEVALEDFVFGNKQAAVAIGEARAVAILAAAQVDIPVYLYKPAEIKLAVTGYGMASKQQVQEMVRLHLELATLPPSADATDAISIALSHIFKRTAEDFINARAKL
jgi:crossover junction endodeoxyribonuclease RuvC